MLRKMIIVAAAMFSMSAQAADITGAGATFPYPIYSKWADAYKKETGNGLNYQSIGSGAGIKQILAKTVTFGASDMPLEQKELDKNGLIQFPTVIGGNVVVFNVDGVGTGQLSLDGSTIADIYMGKINRWNDYGTLRFLPPSFCADWNGIFLRHQRTDGEIFG